jgi:hypothetical protein
MIKQRIYLFAVAVLALFFLNTSCTHQDRWHKADVSNIKTDVKIERLDQKIFTIDSTHFDEQMSAIYNSHKDLMDLFTMRMFHFGPLSNPRSLELFKQKYVYDRYLHDSLYPDVMKAYPQPEINKLQDQFSDAFKYLKYYYPKDTLPQVFTIITAFGYQAFTFEHKLGISLDLFLGKNYRYYASEALQFPEYKTRRFRKEYILPEALKTIYQEKYDEGQMTDQTLLSNMLYAGKNLLFVHALAPDMPDSLLIGYTKTQLKWCKDNEAEVWHHFVSKDLLFTTDLHRVAKYLEDGPFTNADAVPQESAPRLGEWVGYQIVKKYMDENPDVTLDQLCREKDYRKILNGSHYKPEL